MTIGPIFYLTTGDLLTAAREREQHPLIRLLLSQLLMETITSPSEEAARAAVNRVLAQVLDVCSELYEDLRRRYPRFPADPQEQARLWHAATTELLERWGYEDVTASVRQWYNDHAQEQIHRPGRPR